ncbi:MAG TPA: aldo/keto reductase [Armatimonadota bacterium]
MNYTGYTINGKPLPNLSLGCMRFLGRESAAEAIATCAEEGIPYLDTAPGYSYKSEEENCETWVGAGIKGMREKFIVSAKSATGGGGNEIGEYNPAAGFSITTADQVRKQIEQSLTRLGIDRLDYYQLWAVHAPNLFDEALKPGGWMEGALKAKEEGLFDHLGITGHGDTAEVKRWIDSGYFSMVTIPFQMLENSRLEAVHYAREKGVAVIAMNPLAGGLLGSASEALARELADLGVTSAADLALRYSASFPGVSALCGMASAEQVCANVASASKPPWSEEQCAAAKSRFDAMLGSADHLCTACGYCKPCPQGLDIPSILTLRNYHRVLQLETALKSFKERYKYWGVSHQADRCTACGACEKKCPNSLPVHELMAEVMETLGRGMKSAD